MVNLSDAFVSGSTPFFNDTEHVKFVQPCVDFDSCKFLFDVDVDDVVFLSVKEAADAQIKINALIREGKRVDLVGTC
jgi:hypothetical protein